jgi:hypothetical protein
MARPSWRLVRWVLLLAWVPVLLEAGCAYVFPQFEERFPSTILVIPYMEFITMPLTVLGIGLALYKGIAAGIRLHRRSNPSH